MNAFGKLVLGTIWVAGTTYIVCNCVKSKATLESAKRVYEEAVEYDNYSRTLVGKLCDIIHDRINDKEHNAEPESKEEKPTSGRYPWGEDEKKDEAAETEEKTES